MQEFVASNLLSLCAAERSLAIELTWVEGTAIILIMNG
jgi:hypothetical protein